MRYTDFQVQVTLFGSTEYKHIGSRAPSHLKKIRPKRVVRLLGKADSNIIVKKKHRDHPGDILSKIK